MCIWESWHEPRGALIKHILTDFGTNLKKTTKTKLVAPADELSGIDGHSAALRFTRNFLDIFNRAETKCEWCPLNSKNSVRGYSSGKYIFFLLTRNRFTPRLGLADDNPAKWNRVHAEHIL